MPFILAMIRVGFRRPPGCGLGFDATRLMLLTAWTARPFDRFRYAFSAMLAADLVLSPVGCRYSLPPSLLVRPSR